MSNDYCNAENGWWYADIYHKQPQQRELPPKQFDVKFCPKCHRIYNNERSAGNKNYSTVFLDHFKRLGKFQEKKCLNCGMR